MTSSIKAVRRGRANRLTLDQVVDAAAELIADEGFDALTMRRLADGCGVGVMTLYGYVRTKEEILAAVANRFLGEVEFPSGSGGSWHTRWRPCSCARCTRCGSEHPDWPRSPSPSRSTAWLPIAVPRWSWPPCAGAGSALEEAVDAFEVLVCFTAGYTLRQLAFGASSAIAPTRLRSVTGLPAGEFPHLVELAPTFAARNVQRRFDDALEIVLRGIAQRGDGRPDGGAMAGARRARR